MRMRGGIFPLLHRQSGNLYYSLRSEKASSQVIETAERVDAPARNRPCSAGRPRKNMRTRLSGLKGHQKQTFALQPALEAGIPG